MNDLIFGKTTIGNYIIEKELGSGAFATVYLARHKIINLNVAIKVVLKDSLLEGDSAERFEQEIQFMKDLDHPLVAELFEYLEDDKYHYLVMELAQNGNLLNYVDKNGKLSEIKARRYFSQLVSVLEYLHNDIQIAHRDLKPENLLLDRYDNIRVVDFGLSKRFSSMSPKLLTQCGSPAYAAPEMIKGEPYTTAADIWSAGVLLYTLVALELPFESETVPGMMKKIVYSQVKFPPFMSPPLDDLLNKMLTKDPESRITLNKIKDHHWFSQTEYQQMIPINTQKKTQRIEKSITDILTEKGINCIELHQTLLSKKFDSVTAMYRILAKENTIEKMKNITSTSMKGLLKSSSKKCTNITIPELKPKGLETNNLQKRTHLTPRVLPKIK